MTTKENNIEKLIQEHNINDFEALYRAYLSKSTRQAATEFGLDYGNQVSKILEYKGFDLTQKDLQKVLSEKYSDINLDDLYFTFQHNGQSYAAKKFGITVSVMKHLLSANGYDMKNRVPKEQMNNKNGYSVEELIQKHNINPDDLYQVYLKNGGAYTAQKFGLSNVNLVLRILNYYNYDVSGRDIKKINREKTLATIKEKYGKDSALSIPEAKEKFLTTNRERFGSDYYIGSSDFKSKSKKTCLEKYGYEWSTQSPQVKLRHENANYLKYGVKDYKQLGASEKLRIYLNDPEKSKNLLTENPMTYSQLRKYFPDDTESQLWSWRYRFNLNQYLIPEARSAPEEELASFLEPYGFCEICKRNLLGNGQEIDIYNPELKIGVEFNGIYYHSSKVIEDKNYHLNKSKLAESKGIRLIHIYEDEWRDPIKRKKIESLLLIASGNTPSRIYARDCEIRQISNAEAKPFNEENHLQGHRNAQVTYGLFYEEALVQLMSFSRTKYNRNLKGDNDWEIIRGCPGSNNIVVGGVSKLFKNFVRDYNPEHIFSYCDFNKFDGKGYEAIGMKFVGYTGPNKWWVVRDKLVNRNPKKYHELKNISDAVLWGAGSKKYLWTCANIEIS